MNRLSRTIGILAIGMGTTMTSLAREPMIPVESSYELYTLGVSLPRSVPARLTVRECDACTPDVLQLDNTSTFFIGKEEVPYAQFSVHARKQSYSMTVHYTPKTKVVTRMIAAAN